MFANWWVWLESLTCYRWPKWAEFEPNITDRTCF